MSLGRTTLAWAAAWCSLLCLSVAQAAAAEPEKHVPVAVDWSRVPNSFVRRCNLNGLENMLLQVLVEQGYAVVATPGDDGLRLVLRVSGNAVLVAATWREAREVVNVRVPTPCDSTIQLEIAHAAKQALSVVDKERAARAAAAAQSNTSPAGSRAPIAPADGKPSTDAPTPPTPDAPLPPPSSPSPAMAAPAWSEVAQLGIVASGRKGVLPVARVVVLHALDTAIAAGATIELGGYRRDGLWVVEPVLGLQASYELALGAGLALRASVEGGLLAHWFYLNGDHHGTVVTPRVAVPLELRQTSTGIGISIMPLVRFTPVAHRVNGKTAYQADYVGLQISMCVRVP